MRIDMHTYVGHWPFRPLPDNSCAALVERMNRMGVNRSVIGNINSIFYKNAHAGNEELAEWIAPHADRLIPFATLNPTYPDWEHDLDLAHSRLGMKGLRLYPQYHDYEVDDDRAAAMVKAAHSLGMPVTISQRIVDARQRSWLDVDRQLDLAAIAALVKKAPQAQFVILHSFPTTVSDDITAGILRDAGVVFDTIHGTATGVVGPNAYDMHKAIDMYGDQALVFGTATPLRDYVSPFLRIEGFGPNDEAIQGKIWSKNAQRVLRLYSA